MECKAAQCLLILLNNMTCKFSWLCATILEEESFPANSAGKECACSAGDTCMIPGSGRSPGGGDGNPLQYSCLENPSHGQRNLVGYSPWSRTELDTTQRVKQQQL